MARANTNDTHGPYDALILAGDRKASRKVKGKNKSLLVINNRAVICYVVEALARSRNVKDIYVVGPKDRIEAALASGAVTAGAKKVVVLEQWDNLFENIWNGFLSTIPGHKPATDPESYRATPHWDKVILALSGDIPLLTPGEVDEMVEKADLDHYDYLPGITQNTYLSYYYPQRRKRGKRKKRGIKHAYFHFSEGLFRQNNLHLGRPFKVANKIYIEKMYEFRHQREWKDIVKLAFEMLRTEKGSWKSLYYFLVLQSCMALAGMRLSSLADRLRRLVSLHKQVEPTVGLILGTRLRTIETTYGGAALDIDSDYEFETIKANFAEWIAHQDELSRQNGDS
ncbi:MAG: NTP transferase domain-containing protein [Candidatus Dadabacteria bacterium]|nr:NTP transferase domain-containing protein [Candidatus Dadabacteria bacterium]